MARTKSDNPMDISMAIRLPARLAIALTKEAKEKALPISTLCRSILAEYVDAKAKAKAAEKK